MVLSLDTLSHQNWGSQQHISSEWGLDEIGDREAEEEQEDQDAKIACVSLVNKKCIEMHA